MTVWFLKTVHTLNVKTHFLNMAIKFFNLVFNNYIYNLALHKHCALYIRPIKILRKPQWRPAVDLYNIIKYNTMYAHKNTVQAQWNPHLYIIHYAILNCSSLGNLH